MLSPSSSAEVRKTSMLALGAFSAKLGEEADEGSLKALLADEERAIRAGELTLWLEALGNAGAASTVPRIAPYFEHDYKNVRIAACSALRQILTGEATAYLLDRMRSDVDADVRAAAATHVVPRNLAIVNAAAESALLNEEVYGVLDKVVRGLGARQPFDQATRGILQSVVIGARDPRLAETAEMILAPGDTVH